jgi:hypothetical protein
VLTYDNRFRARMANPARKGTASQNVAGSGTAEVLAAAIVNE